VAVVRTGWKRDYLAVVASVAALGAGGLWDQQWAPAASFAVATVAALIVAFTSPGS
jgi:hypothetical protein